MEQLLLTMGVFIAFHVVPAIGSVRRFIVGAMGLRMYIAFYSMVSVGLLVLVGIAYSQADYVHLWDQAYWMRWVPLVLMYPACVFLVGSLVNANPLSVGVRPNDFEVDKPGIVSVTRHPLIWAFLLWSVAHMVANGDLASLLLFGLFTILSLAGFPSLDAKKRRELGAEKWAELAGKTSVIPFAAALTGRTQVNWGVVLCQPTIGGLIFYAVLLGGHWLVGGVDPLP
ncbi:NnrU family protein [Pseudomonadota bacterium]